MTLEEGFRTYLLSSSDLVTKVGDIVTPVLPQNPVDNTLVFKRISGIPLAPTLNGVGGLSRVRLGITVWGSDTIALSKIIALVRSLLDNFNGRLGGASGVKFATITFNGPHALYDPNTKMNGVGLDVFAHVDEDTVS